MSDGGTIATLVYMHLGLEWLFVELSVCQVCVYMLPPASIASLCIVCVVQAGVVEDSAISLAYVAYIRVCGGYDWPALV